MGKRDSFVSQQKVRRKHYFPVISDMGAQRAELKPVPKQAGQAQAVHSHITHLEQTTCPEELAYGAS